MAVDRFFSPTMGRPLAIGHRTDHPSDRFGRRGDGRPAPMRPSVKMGEYETVEPVKELESPCPSRTDPNRCT